MRISQRQFGPARILDLQGPFVGLSAIVRVEQTLASMIPLPSLLVVNLALATELDDGVLCALGAAERAVRRAGGAFRVALPPDARGRCSIRPIWALFDCFDCVEDALADVRASMGRPLHRRALDRVTGLCDAWRRRFW
jgi:hypothetical protein